MKRYRKKIEKGLKQLCHPCKSPVWMGYANDTKREIKILPKNKMNPRGCICIGNKPKREKCKMIVQGHKKEKGHDKVKHRICKEQNWKIWSFCWSYSRIAWIALKERERKRKNCHASIIDMNSYPFPRNHRGRCNERERQIA